MRKQHVLFVIGILLFTAAAFAQAPPAGTQQPMPMPPQMAPMAPGQMAPMAPGQMAPMPPMPPMDCDAMMQKMQDTSKSMDDRLQALVDQMNKAKGSAKVDRMSAVINELVTQRKQMRDQMAAMMPQMMGHMMQHMQSGMMNGMAQSMAGCPMMKAAQQPAADTKH